MLVKNWMKTDPITVDANDDMLTATKVMKEKGIRLLPVMKKGALVGVLTDRDLKRASASDATSLDVHELLYLLSKLKIADIMTRPVITVPFDYTIEEAAQLMADHKISGFPVLDHDENLVGVITQTDIFHALVSLTGLSRRGIAFAMRLKDEPGSIKTAADVIRSFGGRLASILTSYDKVTPGHRKVYIRMYGLDRNDLPQLKKALWKTGDLLYMVDHSDGRREIFQD
jgi:acetoin utilization protein AcuB